MARRTNKYGLSKNERGIWTCDFHVAGQRIQRSTHTADRAAAEEWCATVATRLWREKKLGEKPGLKWEEAVAEWFKVKIDDGKRDLANDRDKALVLAPLLNGRLLHELHTRPEGVREANINLVLDRLQHERDLSNGTRNRYRSFIVGVVNYAKKKGYNAPEIDVERRNENTPEGRALTRSEAPVLLGELPLHLHRPARFSLACGARQSNVTGLRWFKERYAEGGRLLPHVSEDLSAMFVPSGSAKSKKMMRIPLNAEAQEILREARACEKHGHRTFVFTYFGQPIEQPANSAWKKACARAGLPGFKWHWLRHTWTTWHLEAGTPLEVVQKLGGWASIQVLLKHYAHLVHDHISKYAGNVTAAAEVRPVELRVVA